MRKDKSKRKDLNDLSFSVANAIDLLDHVDHENQSTLCVEMPFEQIRGRRRRREREGSHLMITCSSSMSRILVSIEMPSALRYESRMVKRVKVSDQLPPFLWTYSTDISSKLVVDSLSKSWFQGFQITIKMRLNDDRRDRSLDLFRPILLS
jgi:hypothetical protein